VHKVTLGPSDGQSTVIASGLNAGDTVVTDGTDRLSGGAKIKVAPAPAQQVSRGLGIASGKEDERQRRTVTRSMSGGRDR